MGSEWDEAGGKTRRASQRAVEQERAAIAAHELAARLQNESAARVEQSALTERDPQRLDELAQRAEGQRERAVTADHRADAARRRLRDEGVDA